MLVRFIDGPLAGQTREVPYHPAQALIARRQAVDVRDGRDNDLPPTPPVSTKPRNRKVRG